MNPGQNLIESMMVEPLPLLRDVVTVPYGLEPFEQRPGVVIDVVPQPHIEQGSRYRVEYRDGSTAWYGAHEITVDASAFNREAVMADLIAARSSLFHAIGRTERHDVLHSKLGAAFDALSAVFRTYLGTDFCHAADEAENGKAGS
ncbi:hypothetical protein AB0M02_10770 [Actinoplanes sp. NPDC051861]|uniref:hypothetical protein n=1 Tax=Actinoplanes sp. NPDC051861 TaxID=3155170 RepID=UPI00341DC931